MMCVIQSKFICRLIIAAVMSTAGLFVPSANANLITNGSFESNGGVGQLAGGISSLTGWTVGTAIDASPYPYAFVVDSSADSTGFPSVYSPPNITIWGPGTGSNNGFTGSPDGGYFLGVSGTYAVAPVSQTISGLTVGGEYVLSFEWAGSQFSDSIGATSQNWEVTFGGDTVSTPVAIIPSRGFWGWQTFSQSFTATSSTQSLSFLAQGVPDGIFPFLLLDNVKLESNVVPVPEPSTVALLSMGVIGLAIRQRIRKS